MSYMKKEKSKYWNSEIELNKFIDMAERYSIDAILKSITNNRPYGIFTNDIENADENFNSFRLELSEKINKTNNPKAIELDLKDRFYPMLNAYIKFYTDNIERFDNLNEYNPYKIMFDIVNRTKNEIVKYFHISDIEKKELDNELLPNGIFYYEVTHSAFESIKNRLHSHFETINDYADTLNKAIQRNGLIFRQSLNGLNRVEVMDAIKVQYSYYKETCNNMSQWLSFTKDLIIQGFDIEKKLSKEIQYDFNTWYDNELKIIITDTLRNHLKSEFNSWKIELNNPLATELQFLNDKKNECEKAINRAKELNIKLFHGKPSFLLYKETNELTKLEIIKERINELSIPQQSNVILLKTNKLKDNKDNKSFTQKQIAIAYYVLGITLNEKNYLEILKKHSKTTSSKILQKLITKNKQLTTLSNNKTTDTKHLRDLNEAKRLLSGIKKTNEVKLINGYINTFESNYKSEY